MRIQNSKFKIQNYRVKVKTFYFLLVLLPFAFCLLPLGQAHAQETLRTFTIVPPSAEHTLDPGQTAEGIMKVINDSDEPLTFSVSMHDFIVEDTVGTPNLLPNDTLSNKYSAASWIGVSPMSFTVAPHQRQELTYYIQVPLDARPGGHYAAVVFKPKAPIDVEGTGTAIHTFVGTLIYIPVNGPIKESSFVSKFFANMFQEYGPVDINTQIKNLGDLHIRPTGTVKVTDILGRTIQEEKLKESNIFPEAARDYKNTVGQQWMIGPFKTTLLASYGKGNNLPLTATMYFWVFPWKITLLVVLIIIAAVLGKKYWDKRGGTHSQSTTETHTEVKPQS